jgi:hypothetical protein
MTLPDVPLLEIFHFYTDRGDDDDDIEAWHTPVHVCRKWRLIVFGSPRRLDLRLLCDDRTPVEEMLHIWPPFPIVIWSYCTDAWSVDDIVAALEHNNRIRQLDLESIMGLEFEKILAVMQRPFPALKCLRIYSPDKELPGVPASFLGGSAPRLQVLYLEGIPFPGLPQLLLSATQLVHLDIRGIPHSGFISSDTMVDTLSGLTMLGTLIIGSNFSDSSQGGNRPDWKRRRPPLLRRAVLPVLTKFVFRGVDEYLEDFVARIDVPLLNKLDITFFHPPILDTPQLIQFICRTPKFKPGDKAYVELSDWEISVTLPQTPSGRLSLGIGDSSTQPDWQLSSLVHVCRSFFPHTFISPVEHLDILEEAYSELNCLDDIESSQWLDLLRQFSAVNDLHITRKIAPYIARALRELVEERVTEVLPALQILVFEEPEAVRETIGPFITARRLADHPISISRWEIE